MNRLLLRLPMALLALALLALASIGWGPGTAPAHSATPSPTPTPGLLAADSAPDYIPILMYHYILDPKEAAEQTNADTNTETVPNYALAVPPALFEQQVAWLIEHGYTTVTMEHLARCMRGQARCPAKPVALTFDDGYADAYTAALPILRKYQATATFYLVTEFIGQPGYLTWAQVRALHRSGMEIGAHTLSHADLPYLAPLTAYREMSLARVSIGREIGAPVRSFCYPYGHYTLELAEAARRTGYTNATTTFPGDSLHHLYTLPRRRVRGDEVVDAMRWYVVPPSNPATVVDAGYRVRAGPGSTHRARGLELTAGEHVEILGQVKLPASVVDESDAAMADPCTTWFEIRTAENERGWVCSEAVRLGG